jgi:hypothetical protein
MNRFAWIACAVAVLSLAACGSKNTNSESAGAPKPTPSGTASAEQVAREMRGNVKCPATASTERPSGAPVDDVVGIRPGMSWDEAANFVMCDNPMLVVTETTSRNYNINTYGRRLRQGFEAQFAQPRVAKTSQQILEDMRQDEMRRSGNTYVAPLKPGQVRYFVSTMGLPGHEQVLSVAREEYFAEGKLPPVDSVKQALITKYGEPSQTDPMGQRLLWEYDPAGAKITQGSPRLGQCGINVSPDASISLSSDCGITVGAAIQSANNNPGLAHSLAVTSQNGAAGMAALTSTERALRSGEEARKAKEVNDSAKGAEKPKL